MLSYRIFAKFRPPTRGGAASPWHSSNIILSAAGLPNKRILRSRLNHFCPGRCYRLCGRPDLARDGFPVNFASDNTAAIAPGIMDALTRANDGFALGYGNDALTRAVERRIGEVFEMRGRGVPGSDRHRRQCAVAGACHAALGRSAVPRAGAYHDGRMRGAGILRRRPQADRASGRGCQAHAFDRRKPRSRAIPAMCRIRSTRRRSRSPRRPRPAPSTGSRRSRRLAELAHAHGLPVHMDGARFGNALARMNVTPAEATWKAGVDVLSFGATKGGAMAAEAVVFFDPARAAFMARAAQARRAAALEAPFPGGAIRGLSERRLLAHACAPRQCDGRSSGRRAARGCGVPIVWPVEANIVFALLPNALDAKLKAAGRGLLCASQYAGRRRCRDRARSDAGAAGDLVRDPDGRGRSIRCAGARGLTVSEIKETRT